MVSTGRGRKGRPYRRWQQQVHDTYPNICYLCGRTILHGVYPPRHPQAPSVDHVVPLDRGGAELDLDNGRPAHYGCNSAKGNKVEFKRMPTSRTW
jgi:5-methylcytosine-specific restriction endonuclease McrA